MPLAFEAPHHKPKSKVVTVAIAAVLTLVGLAAVFAVARNTACCQVQQGPSTSERCSGDHSNFVMADVEDAYKDPHRLQYSLPDAPPPFAASILDATPVDIAPFAIEFEDLSSAFHPLQGDIPVIPLPTVGTRFSAPASVKLGLDDELSAVHAFRCDARDAPSSSVEVAPNATFVLDPLPVCYTFEKPPTTTAAPFVSFDLVAEFAAGIQARVLSFVVGATQGLWYLIIQVARGVKILGWILGALGMMVLRMLLAIGRVVARVLMVFEPGML